MAFLKRNLYPEATRADRCTLLFDTDSKRLYVELEVAHSGAAVEGRVDHQTATMDIADYLKQGGQTAGRRELRQLLRTLKDNGDSSETTDETSSAATTYNEFRIWENFYCV